MTKRFITALAAVLIFISSFSSVCFASEADDVFKNTLNSKQVVVTCADNNQKLLEKNPLVPTAPAGSAKLMTALLVVEYMETVGKDISSTTYTIPSEISKQFSGVANINLQKDEEVTIAELLYSLLVSNANDACLALAMYVAGTEEKFVELMNKKADELGAENTNYINCTGFDGAGGETTAYDASLVLSAFYARNELVEMTKVTRYTMRATNKSSSRAMNNKNHLISKILTSKYYSSEAVGLMYTYTEEAGHCLFTAVVKDELTFLVVLMGSTSVAVSTEDTDHIMCFNDAADVFGWCSGFGYQTLVSSSNLLGQIEVTMSSSSEAVSYHPAETIEFLVKTTEFDAEKISRVITLTDEAQAGLEAPVTKDDKIGIVEIWYGNTLMGTTDVVLTSSVDRSEMLYIWAKIQSVLFSKGMKTAGIIFVSLIALYILLSIVLKIVKTVRRIKRKKARKAEGGSGKRRVYYYVDDDDDDADDDYYE
ncbi:MAG TPA: hypothetical protein PLT66_00560 [Bacillota bacterium]|nr:hypothetical protein [Bacillota bacterium]